MQAATAVPNQRGDRRGQQGGARRADPPSPPPPPPASRATLRKIECAAAVLAAAVQILVYRRTFSTVTPRAHAHQLALVALHIAAAAVVCLAPHRAWQVWRVPAVALLRALIVSVPSYRSITEGAAMLMHRPASPGVGGATLDYLHMAMGSRQLLSAVFSGLLHHPPWAVAAQQALHVLLTGSAGDYCRTELLTHPVSQQRIAAVARALELLAAFPLPGGIFLTGGVSGSGLADPRADCVAVLHLHQIGCILAPTLVASLLHRHSPLAPPRNNAAWDQQTGWRRLPAAAQRQLAWAGDELRAAVAGAHPAQQALLCWLVLVGLWTLAQVLDA